MSVRVALIGCGRWGQNLLRVLCESPRAELCAVVDPCPRRRAYVKNIAPHAAIVPALEEALDLGITAVVIATPAHTHAALTLAALDAGVDVLVEKPLALSVAEAERCAKAARTRGRIAMVGHLLRYHPTMARLFAMVHKGSLGALLHIEAERLSVRCDRSASVLWTLGPHDVSILHALEPGPLHLVEALAPPSGDETRLMFTLASGSTARITLSRVHPTKERRITLVGTERTAVFDDVHAPYRVLLGRTSRSKSGLDLRVDDEIPVTEGEPLALEIEHFLRSVEERTPPLTPLEDGVAVVQTLARAELLGRSRPEDATEPLSTESCVESCGLNPMEA